MSVIQRLFPTRCQELEGLFRNYVCGNTQMKLTSLEKCIKKVSASDMVNLIQTVVDDLRRTVLHKASLLGEKKLVDCILAAVPMEKREIVLSMVDMEGSTALLLAASEGHEEVVECIMFIFNYQERAKRSSLLKIKNDVGDTALSCAAYHGYEKVVVPIVTKVSPADRKELLQLENDKGNTALHIAAQGGYTSTVKNLLAGLSHDDLTSFVRNCNDAGETVVFAAAVGGHTETVRYLREDSCTWKEILMIPNKKQETVVYRVASNGNIETLEELLTPFQAADIKRELLMLDRTDGDNVLFCLASRGHSKTLQYVLESVDPHRRFNMLNARNKNGKTVAHIAAGVGHTETIKVMIETLMVTQKFDLLSLRDSDNQNVLACASRKDQAACVGYMLTALDPDQRLQLLQRKNGGGHGILHSVAARGFSNTMKVILESVTDEVDSVTFRRRYELLLEGSDSGSCPLREAILVPHLETTQTALNMLDLETRNNLLRQTYLDDETILHWVARSDSSEMLDYILQVFSSLSNEERSNILKLQDIDGNTALATAASRGYTDIILGMVHSIDDDLGYDLLQLANNKGQTALCLAATKGHLSMTHSVLDTLPSAKLSGHKLCTVKGLKERREELIRARRSSTEKVQQYKSESRDLSDSFNMHDSAALQSKRQAAMEQYETQVKEQEKIQEEISSELNDCMELLYELDPGYRPEEADAVDDSELLDSELSSNCCEACSDQRSTEEEPQNLPGTEQAEKLYPDNNFIYLPYTDPIPELLKDILPTPAESEDLQKLPVKTNVKTTLEAGEETKYKRIELKELKVEQKVLEEERKTAAEERRSLKEKQKECVDSKGKELYQTQIDNQERKLETLAQELNGCRTKIIQLETELHETDVKPVVSDQGKKGTQKLEGEQPTNRSMTQVDVLQEKAQEAANESEYSTLIQKNRALRTRLAEAEAEIAELKAKWDAKTEDSIASCSPINSTTEGQAGANAYADADTDSSDSELEPTSDDEYVTIPPELLQMLTELCHEHSIEDGLILQSPHKWESVAVLGIDAHRKLIGPLKDFTVKNPQFNDYTLTPYDRKTGSERAQLGNWQRSLSFNRITETEGNAVCELIVQTSNPAKVFVVGPAHLLFCKEANEKFQSVKCDIARIRDAITKSPPRRTVTVRSGHSLMVDIEPNPLIAYRYDYEHSPPADKLFKLYRNDCVMYPFDSNKANNVYRDLRDARNAASCPETKLRKMSSPSQLQIDHSIRREVVVQNYEGRLYHQVDVEESIRCKQGLNLTFALTSTDKDGTLHKLTNGDSGSIVYCVGNDKEGRRKHIPWGMLVESSQFPPFELYHAIVLSQAFKDIQDDYHMGEITLFSPNSQ